MKKRFGGCRNRTKDFLSCELNIGPLSLTGNKNSSVCRQSCLFHRIEALLSHEAAELTKVIKQLLLLYSVEKENVDTNIDTDTIIDTNIVIDTIFEGTTAAKNVRTFFSKVGGGNFF